MKTIIKNTLAFRSTFYVLRSTIYVFRSTFYTNVLVLTLSRWLSGLALLLMLITLFASCSKYEDGPWISFRSPEKRIEGTWQVEYFCRNNEDLTDFYIQNYNWRFGFGSSNPEDPTQPAYMCRQLRSNCEYDSLDTISITNVFSYWRFFANDSLQMPILTLPGEYPPYCGFYPLFPGVSEFKILKLTYSKLWLEHTKNDTTYLIKMKK